MARILIGTAGWTDPTLLRTHRFYPPEARTAEARLRYYATQFPLVEVDSTYYAPPTRRNVERWVERTPDDFTFNIKAFSLLTGHPTRPDALDRDLREQLPAELLARRNLYPADVGAGVVDECFRRFTDALEPLARAGKLGAVLLQFPPWFEASAEHANHIKRTADHLAGLRVAVELRHESWLSDDYRERTERFLARLNLPFVCVDMPQGFRSSMPPLPLVTSPSLALVRFHGRNTATWGVKSDSAHDRFLYLYRPEELGEWRARIESIAAQSREVHLIMNNCFEDYAVRNGRDLGAILGTGLQPGASLAADDRPGRPGDAPGMSGSLFD